MAVGVSYIYGGNKSLNIVFFIFIHANLFPFIIHLCHSNFVHASCNRFLRSVLNFIVILMAKDTLGI
jgi:hypothetical protein